MSTITSIEILSQPAHGHVSVNPDNTIAFVGGADEYTGPVTFTYRVQYDDASTRDKQKSLEITEGTEDDGWGTSEYHYMLPVDENDRVITETGDRHRKVYASGAGLSAADIAALEGMTEAEVRDPDWLQGQTSYGGTEETALDAELAIILWGEINGFPNEDSNWLLLERGYSYNYGWAGFSNLGAMLVSQIRGESPLHPVTVSAWGTGARPRITSGEQLRGDPAENIVVRDLDFVYGVGSLNNHKNIMFEHCTFGNQCSLQGNEGLPNPNYGFTFRNCIIKDIYRDEPTLVVDGKWDPRANRMAGMFIRGTVGLLLEGVIFDRGGWAPDFAPDGSETGGHPPSQYSHNMYIHKDTRDVTMRNSITMRASSFGSQFRGGAHLDNNIYLDNNIPVDVVGGNYGGDGFIGEYSLLLGNLTTVSARRGGGCPAIGALDWGVRNTAMGTSMVGSIVAHANDPDEPGDTYLAENAVKHFYGEGASFYDDTVIWRWGIGQNGPGKPGGPDGGSESNVEGLDPAVMNTTTIQRYTADLLSQGTATIDDFAEYLRGLDGSEYQGAVLSVLSYFRAGFGISETARVTSATLRFIPDYRAEGVRWDNRLNWDSGDLPGTVAGDSVDLGGNKVVFGGTVDIDNLTFGKYGKLTANHGCLRVSGDVSGGEIEIGNVGQVRIESAQSGAGPLDVSITSGRFAVTADYAEPGNLTATGGETILATTGTTFTIDGELTKGPFSKVGFDGEGTGTATLTVLPSATLRFNQQPSGGFTPIRKFRSGAFGDNSNVTTNIELDGTIEINLDGYTGGAKTITLIEADDITGDFAATQVNDLPGGLSASVNKTATSVTLVIS